MQCTNTLTLTLPQYSGVNPSLVAEALQNLLNCQAQLNTVLGNSTAYSDKPITRSLTLQQAAERMIRDFSAKGTWSHGTAYKNKSQLTQIICFLGTDRPVDSLDIADLTALQESLNYKKKNTQTLIPLDEIHLQQIELNELVGGETAHRYFNLFKQFINYCVKSKFIASLPLHEVTLPRQSAMQSSYKTFSPLELEGVFYSRAYTTEGTAKFRWTLFSYCFWLPLLAVFTGARPGELCQLYAGDIYKNSGIPVMRITNEGPEQRLKTPFSGREIPIHPKLIEIGFLDFVAMRLKEGGRYRPLFPELPYDKKHGFARTASRWFSGQGANDHGYLPECGFYKGEGACLYSFRHTFVDMLRNKLGVQEMMIKKLVGHGTRHDTTINYGTGFSLAQRQEITEKVDIDVDISHISWENYQRLQQRKPHCHKEKRKALTLRSR